MASNLRAYASRVLDVSPRSVTQLAEDGLPAVGIGYAVAMAEKHGKLEDVKGFPLDLAAGTLGLAVMNLTKLADSLPYQAHNALKTAAIGAVAIGTYRKTSGHGSSAHGDMGADPVVEAAKNL